MWSGALRNGLDFCGGRGEVVMRKAYVVPNVCRQCVEMRKVDRMVDGGWC